MRQIVILLFCSLFSFALTAQTVLQDSLLQLLVRSTHPQQQTPLLRNLADIHYALPQERNYLEQLIEVARKSGNQEILTDALGDLAYSYIRDNQTDSARYYIKEIEQLKVNSAKECWQSYLKIRLFDTEVRGGSGIDAINEELKKQSSLTSKSTNIYEKIENSYIISSGLDAQGKYKEAIPYTVAALNLAAALPFKEGLKVRVAIMRSLKLLYINSGQFEEVTPLVEEYIALQEKHYQQFLKEKRPFYPIESDRIAEYSTLIINIRHLTPQKANYYLQSIMDLSNKTIRPRDKYSCFLSINNYYLFKQDFPKALASNDSLIKYARVLGPYIIPKLMNTSSQIYEAMKDYKGALQMLKESYALRDSLDTHQSMEQLNKLQVQYDLDKLNFEKSQLEVRNKQILLISLSIVLLISIFVSTHLYRTLKKEKIMKAKLRSLKIKAEESENMKTVFINSICHEIRTPLNAIVGFSDLIIDSSIDEELRQTFPEEIQRNTQVLTGLISSMLEVANLDVSDEKLPCEPADIHSICHSEMDRIKTNGKPGLHFLFNVPETPLMITTHAQYLALVIENLLSNANKFTANGRVTLEYHVDQGTDCLQISVTDTGCGIPPEKHEEVFNRFSKLDSFIPGNGLGLYLCRLIVRRLSGHIHIDSEYTRGTRVIVSLPMQ